MLSKRTSIHEDRVKMGRRCAGAVAILAALVALAASPGYLSAGIEGSSHDFSELSENQQICVFCHTPHEADSYVTAAPLWNHTVTTKQFQLYNSRSLDAVISQPAGRSRLCLSCHDGTVAIDAFGGRDGVVQIQSSMSVGGDPQDLANDHPIGFIYDDTLAARDGELHFPSSSPSGMGETIDKDLLFDNILECSSCHDVHNGPEATAINDSLLVVTQSQSQLCLTCHDK